MKEISHFLDAGKIDPADSGRPQMLNNPGDWPYSSVVALNLRHYSSSLKFQISLARIKSLLQNSNDLAVSGSGLDLQPVQLIHLAD